jgi:hypothetical protein
MFSNPETLSRATRDLFDAQMAFFTQLVQSATDLGVNATEHHVDAMKTLLATATVDTRQWLNGGSAGDWMTPVPQFARQGRLTLAAPPAGARAMGVPQPVTAARTSVR